MAKTEQSKNYASDFASQIRQNLMDEIKDEEWVIKSVGRNLLEKNNLLPTIENPIKVKDLYEAFLRFDDKPMILGESAIKETVNSLCTNGVFNVAFGTPGHWTRIYKNETVPFLEVSNDDLWLVDTSVVIAPQTQTTPQPPTTETSSTATTTATTAETPAQSAKSYRRVTISGQVPLENYAQLFGSFVNILKNNNLKIEVKFTASSTPANPLTDNSAIVKSVLESARQLGLNFEAEE